MRCECYGVVERMHNYRLMLSDKRPPPPSGTPPQEENLDRDENNKYVRNTNVLDCRAALAMNPSEAQDAARTESAGDIRAGSAK